MIIIVKRQQICNVSLPCMMIQMKEWKIFICTDNNSIDADKKLICLILYE